MRAVVQRVKSASVVVEQRVTGSIDAGLLVYLGIMNDDTEKDLTYMADKILGLRIFSDEAGNMNRSVCDTGLSMLLVSQFTLAGDVRKGRRPSFARAMKPDAAKELYNLFVDIVRDKNIDIQTGQFRAMMEVSSINDGPVTILLDSKKIF
jgi:D-tyrosyl-tRNA(Tyr) deacylase